MIDDPLVRARVICRALGDCSRRSLYAWVRAQRFPPPDRPASRRGEPDLWRESTVMRGIEQFTKGRSAA